MTSREDVNRLSEATAKLVAMARADLRELMASMDLTRPNNVKAALLELVPMLVREYGELSAVAAAEWYEELRSAANVTGAHATLLSDGIEDGPVRASVGQAVGALWTDNPQGTLLMLEGALQRHIKYGARDTIRRNAGADRAKPRYARVPRGAKTCAFCTMLSSRGFVYLTAKSAGKEDPSHYHDHCNCEAVVEFDNDAAHIAGYDPDAMYAKYQAALGVANTYDPSELAKAMRRLYPDDLTDGVKALT